MPGPISYPLVNGNRYSYVSVETVIAGQVMLGISSINYSDKLDPGIVKGTSMNIIGMTAGDRTLTCDIEMLRLEWDNLLSGLTAAGAGGYGLAFFDIFVSYSETFAGAFTSDSILGCRITEASASNQKGTDPTMVKLTIQPTNILMNGSPIAPPDFV
ncbi:MAG: hypothetical protein EPN98_21485 [Phenylobacterium sp.]|uniref:hypothetical protein n=1 Tax=Phenylobacterium sp. TaxID=1871053 RepID=UPI00121AC256|nr:hypothetical protein [Phenylobacterium sp.]TAL29018.1 MAG: hypothetical protein EPN98_21485 [Phenylobacterium sp.]